MGETDEFSLKICSELGYSDPELTEGQAVTIMQYVWYHNEAFLVDNLAYISQCGETYSPAFKRFLADVVRGELKKPGGRPQDRAKAFKIIDDLRKLIKQGSPLNGKARIDCNDYAGGIVEHLALKHLVSEKHVNTLQRQYRKNWLEHYKSNLREFRPELKELDPCITDALAEQDFKKFHPNLPVPSKKE